MKKALLFVSSGLIISCLIFSYKVFTAKQIFAAIDDRCCTAQDCGYGQACGGAPSPCPDSNGTYGSCKSKFEACGNNSKCQTGECCDATSKLCFPCGGACFPAGTKVTLSDTSVKNIEDVKIGDNVLSEDENGKQSVSTVQQLEQPVSDNMCEIKYTDGESLKVTKGHPLATSDGWKAIDPAAAASESPGVPVTGLKTGDQMVKSNGSATISSIACWNQPIQTYNLSVDNSHTYFAGGFLAHNKGQRCTDCGGWSGMWLTSLTANDSSFTINWDGDWGGLNIACGKGGSGNNWHFIVYLGTDYNAVNGSCNGLDGTYDYRGVGSPLPLGCQATRRISSSARSFSSSAASPPITLLPHTIYYVKVALWLDYSNQKADIYTHGICGAGQAPILAGSCSVSPNPQTMNIGQVQTFTTDAYEPQTIIPTYPAPVVSSVVYDPNCVSHCNGKNPVYQPLYHIYGNNFGSGGEAPKVTLTHGGNTYFIGHVATSSNSEIVIALQNMTPNNFANPPFVASDAQVTYPTPPDPWVQNVGKGGNAAYLSGQYLGAPGTTDHVKIRGYTYWYGGGQLVSHEGDYPVGSDGRIVIDFSNWFNCSDQGCLNLPNYYIVSYTNNKPNVDLTTPNNVNNVTFAGSGAVPPYISPTPAIDTSFPYQSNVTALRQTDPLSTTLTSDVFANNFPSSWKAASCVSNITVTGNSPPLAWVQASGGDVYASGSLYSPLPYLSDPRVFVLNGPGGYPGVVTYGESFDFDYAAGNGADYVSSTNWLANDTPPVVDYYQLLFKRFGGEPASWDYNSPASPISQPAYKDTMDTPYYVKGDMVTSGNWTVDSGKKLIFIVDGNLTIDGAITTTGNGFVAFIVNGNITVDPGVGVPYSSSTPVLSGVYITAPGKSFDTGLSSVVGHERLVGYGTFVAGDFLLRRDLTVDHNRDASAELFIYNPGNLITMPDAMKEAPVTWQEVAP